MRTFFPTSCRTQLCKLAFLPHAKPCPTLCFAFATATRIPVSTHSPNTAWSPHHDADAVTVRVSSVTLVGNGSEQTVTPAMSQHLVLRTTTTFAILRERSLSHIHLVTTFGTFQPTDIAIPSRNAHFGTVLPCLMYCSSAGDPHVAAVDGKTKEMLARTLGACLGGSLAVSPCGAASRATFVFQADTLSSSAVSIFTDRRSTWSARLRFRNRSYTHCQDCSIEMACRAPTARRTRYRQEVVSQRQAQNVGLLARLLFPASLLDVRPFKSLFANRHFTSLHVSPTVRPTDITDEGEPAANAQNMRTAAITVSGIKRKHGTWLL